MRYLLLLCFLISSSFSLLAQTTETEKKLAELVTIYNEMSDFQDLLTAGEVYDEDFVELYFYESDAKPLINYINQYGNEDQKATARYFEMFIQYELSFTHGMAGEHQEAYAIMSNIKSDFEYFSNQSVYPLRYVLNGLNYTISYSNFETTLVEYYTSMSEICANIGKADESLTWAKKEISMRSSILWYNYISFNKAIDAKKNLKQIDSEYIDMLIEWVKTYNTLDTTYLTTIRENKYPSPILMSNKLVLAVDSLTYLAKNGDQLASFARTIKTNYPYPAADVYTRILKLDQASLSNVDEALSFYKELVQTNTNAFLWSNEGNTKDIVRAGCNKMKGMLNSNSSCFYWTNLSTYYSMVEETALSLDALEHANICQKEADRAAKKASRKANSEFGLCLSAYPIPMIWGNFGGSVEFNFEKVALTVAATKIGHDKDYQNDFYNPIQADMAYFDYYGNELDRETLYYNGSRVNTSLKFLMAEQSDTRGYFSLNLGRVMKTYDPILTSIYDTITAAPVYYGNIVAKEKKYTFFVGFGAQGMLSDRWMIDAGLGIGVSLPTLTVDSPYFSDRYYFNSYLVQSSQDNKIGMSGYMNVSIGYYLFKP